MFLGFLGKQVLQCCTETIIYNNIILIFNWNIYLQSLPNKVYKLKNYKISDFTPMPNTGHCQFSGSEVEPNSP